MRKNGRPKHDRLRAMRFALWAQHVPPRLLTIRQIGGLLDVSKSTAARWRTDWLKASGAAEIEGVPSFLTPPVNKRTAAKPTTGHRNHQEKTP